jgi:hypothetical protein
MQAPGPVDASSRPARAVVLPDDELATLFVERGDELEARGPVGVDRGAPWVADSSADVLAWARERDVFVWRGLFAEDPTLDEPLTLPAHIDARSRRLASVTALALAQSVLFATCEGAALWGGWDLSAPGRPWFDAPEHEPLGGARMLALGGDVLSVLFSRGRAQFDVSDPRRPRVISVANAGLDEAQWGAIRAIAAGEWVITIESKRARDGSSDDDASTIELRPAVYSLAVYRCPGLTFAGRVLLATDAREEGCVPAIDAVDERLLLVDRRNVRLIDLRALDQLMRDAQQPLAITAIAYAIMVGGALDADALDARLYGGASAAVSVSRATSDERLARLEARRNPWEPSGVAMPRAQIVRLSFADSGD